VVNPETRYDSEFNPDPSVSPYGWAYAAVAESGRVLDLGCGNAVVAATLAREKSCPVLCVDIEAHPKLRVASDQFRLLDLASEGTELADTLREFQPRYVLLLDVLEHLTQPWELLQRLREAAPQECELLISLPCVSNSNVVLRLLCGDFSYQDSGLLDEGHLRFFTPSTAQRMLARAGWSLREEASIRLPLVHQEWSAPLAAEDAQRYASWTGQVNPGAEAYQVLYRVGADTASEEDPLRGWVENRVSVVVRSHDPGRHDLLEEALFSLALQRGPALEPIVVLQNPSPEVMAKVRSLLADQPWASPTPWQVHAVQIPAGEDGRAALLNRGMAVATGRYLAFLDDDDLMYQGAYACLVDELERSGRAIAVGGSRVSVFNHEGGHRFVTGKAQPFTPAIPPTPGQGRIELFTANFVPIHSYVIDRSRLGAFELRFDETYTLLEDYEFLLRLCAVFEPSFAAMDRPVAEYRLEGKGSERVLIDGARVRTPAEIEACLAAEARVHALRQELSCLVRVSDLANAYEHVRVARAVQQGYAYRGARWLSRTFDRVPGLKSTLGGLARKAERSGQSGIRFIKHRAELIALARSSSDRPQ
jgi:2-polyprenyl-3-methyl-5-hydroxy-6-metoxy-1,4-benzoquinol methylase